MMASLIVHQPGLYTTVQDAGRYGHQRFGVPLAGALDLESFWLANALVGNPWNNAALEVRMLGPVLEVCADAVRLALTGTKCPLKIARAGREERVPAYQGITVERGAMVTVPPLTDSANAYLAVSGGLAVPPILGSASTLTRAGFGGIDGRALASGDVLHLHDDCEPDGPDLQLRDDVLALNGRIRVVLGPQLDYFSSASIDTFLQTDWEISNDADRMGIRLVGPQLEHTRGFNIASDGIATGSIQVPGSGQPIILLADRQTTGGYPKIATVISTDLPLLGRARPGERLRFESVSADRAIELRRERWARLRHNVARATPVLAERAINMDALQGENLVSGVWSSGDD